jgi:glycosyltransferase involved in cell wall biosynthesis
MKEIITNDFNGLLAEPESAESLADNILKLLDDPEKMQRLSRNAITDSQKRFSPVTVAKQTEVYYRSIMTS